MQLQEIAAHAGSQHLTMRVLVIHRREQTGVIPSDSQVRVLELAVAGDDGV